MSPRTIAICTLLATTGCYDGVQRLDRDSSPGADGADGGGPGGGADGADTDEPANAGEDPGSSPFEVPGDEVKLLPFSVRMENLARVTGVETSNPIFFKLHELRYQLGDHDYSQLVAPDLRWSPQKMAAWVRGLGPVCESTVVHAKYPDLVTDPSALVRDAYAREVEDDDLAALADIATAGYDDAMTYQLTCVAILSSLDFVAR